MSALQVADLCSHARCDRCDERMCEMDGPESRPGCGARCVDCPPCDCTVCEDTRADALMEAACERERDVRAGMAE